MARPTGNLSDTLGSVRLLTDATGASPATYAYSAFGSTRKSTGTLSNEVRFSGERTDTESGLEFLRTRTYDSSTGTFLQRDSWGISPTDSQSLDAYLYTADDPADQVDPSGHCAQAAALGTVVGPEGTVALGAACVAFVTSGAWVPVLATGVATLAVLLGLKDGASPWWLTVPAAQRAAPGPIPTIPPFVLPYRPAPPAQIVSDPETGPVTPGDPWKNLPPVLKKVVKKVVVPGSIISLIANLLFGDDSPATPNPSPSPSPTPTPSPKSTSAPPTGASWRLGARLL